MEGLLHDAWVLFVGIGSWMVNKLTAKLDGLEKGKADAGQIFMKVTVSADLVSFCND